MKRRSAKQALLCGVALRGARHAGELTELEVWHDNSGVGAAWHLNYIEVQCSTTGKVRAACRLAGRPCAAPGQRAGGPLVARHALSLGQHKPSNL